MLTMKERYVEDIKGSIGFLSSLNDFVKDINSRGYNLAIKVVSAPDKVLDEFRKTLPASASGKKLTAYFGVKIVDCDSYKTLYVYQFAQQHIHNYYVTSADSPFPDYYAGTFVPDARPASQYGVHPDLINLKVAIKSIFIP